MNPTKIISGGQIGADQGGLAAGYDLGIETGGWAPLKYYTKTGSNYKLKSLGLIECEVFGYAERTERNVRDSDGTIRFCNNFNTPGEWCTLKAIKKHKKPYFDVNLKDYPFMFDILDWFKTHKIIILNVAGNTGETKEETTQIFSAVRSYLKSVLVKLKDYTGNPLNQVCQL